MKYPRHLLHLLCLLITAAALSQCAVPVSADKKAALRKVAVVNYVEPAIKRYKVGFTAFGNVLDDKLVIDELRPRLQGILAQETRRRFAEVVEVPNPPALPMSNPLTGRGSMDRIAAEVGRQTGADAVLIVTPYPSYPYGVPSYMTAEGLGYWHIGKDQAFVICYATAKLHDATTGKALGTPFAYRKHEVTKGIPWKERFTDHPPAERELIFSHLLQAYRWNITTGLQSLGF